MIRRVKSLAKKQMLVKVDPEIVEMKDELVTHINKSLSIGKTSSSEVVSLAIKELYKNYLGDKVSKSTKERYGIK